jgi:hypothetical protein
MATNPHLVSAQKAHLWAIQQPKRVSNERQIFKIQWGIPPTESSKCNDPSAGSPTDTLLRLLLPLNDTIWGNSNVVNRNQPQTPYYSLNHSIGNSDGRCVQRPETYSMPVSDRRLLGIPRSWRIIANVNPQHDWRFKDFPTLSGQGRVRELQLLTAQIELHNKLFYSIIVARERPRTSESITDLLSPTASPD